MNVTECNFQKEYFKSANFEHHAISYDAIKDKLYHVSISRLNKNNSILVWLDLI